MNELRSRPGGFAPPLGDTFCQPKRLTGDGTKKIPTGVDLL
jgi:hypothetical protein